MASFLLGWNYRKKITLTGQTGAGTNYPVLIKVGEGAGSAGVNFHCEGNATFPDAADSSKDLRFTDSSGTTLLSFWVEAVAGVTPNRVAYVWVKVTDSLETNVDIYCYYGSSTGTNASDGTQTFDNFDNFNNGTVDYMWTKENDTTPSGNYISETNRSGYLRLGEVSVNNNWWSGTFDCPAIKMTPAITNNFEVITVLDFLPTADYNHAGIGVLDSSNSTDLATKFFRGHQDGNQVVGHQDIGGSFDGVSESATSNIFLKLRKVNFIYTLFYKLNISDVWSQAGSEDDESGFIADANLQLRLFEETSADSPDNTKNADFNYFYLKKFNSIEPSFNSTSAQEAATFSSDILTGGTASASSVYSGSYTADKAVDDNNSTWFNTSSSLTPGGEWWKYDLGVGVTKTVNKLTIRPYTGNSSNDFILQGSNDDSSWSAVYTGTGSASTGLDTYTFPNNSAYRYYRIVFLPVTAYNLAYYEFQMMEEVVGTPQRTITSDALIITSGIQYNILSDAKIKVIGNQQTILSDTEINASTQQYLLSDAKILVPGNQQTILSDAVITNTYLQTILSNASIATPGLQFTILSDARLSEVVLENLSSKINFNLGGIANIASKFNLVVSVISNMQNRFNSCKAIVANIVNDFRAQKRTENDIHNDCRFILAAQQYQTPAGQRLQSLGKGYVHVYINGVDQTHVDIDSIRISKQVSVAHTASFELATPYDSTPPAMEALVTIYYSGWLLYRGYIRNISTVEAPEHIMIECESKCAEDNEHNKYFHVGHQPASNLDLYYETIKKAITTEFGWSPDIGDFTPSAMNIWGVKESDALTQLIEECGNYGWYYDLNENRVLWVGGQGRIVNLHRQELGQNLDLYDILDHKLDTNIDNVVNKYIVIMGVLTQTQEYQYSLYNYAHYDRYAEPAWDRNLEIPSWVNSSGEGYDYNTDPEKYRDVFKVYDLPYLNPQLENYTDEFPPYLRIWADAPIWNGVQGQITDGFTIDYAHGKLILNEPIFAYNPYYDTYGAVTIQVGIWAKQLVTFTSSKTQNPEENVNSPLKFITDKVGSYATEITEVLNLPDCDIRTGFSMYVGGNLVAFAQSWNDTDYAKDYAYWQLSKTREPKITGNIEVTLDCACFNNIELACRISSVGITPTPLNIQEISYDLSTFKVSISVENTQYYKRTMSKPTHAGEF